MVLVLVFQQNHIPLHSHGTTAGVVDIAEFNAAVVKVKMHCLFNVMGGE